jgi:branched-chain amino acid transport system substrate-binding protein
MRYGLALAAAVATVALAPMNARAADNIKIGFPIPLSGPTAVYGEPILKGAQMAVAEINAKGGVLGRKFELLPRDSKANADEAVRLSRELIIKDNVDFLLGTLTSAEAPAVSTVAKENKILFMTPSSKSVILTDAAHIHPYVFRLASNTDVEGLAGATELAKFKDVKRVATIAPDYAYGHDSITGFKNAIKKLRPDIQVVDSEWPKLGEPDFTAFINAMLSKKPDAVYCSLFAGDFVTFVKQATPLGLFKVIHNQLVDGGEVGAPDEAQALGADYPYGIVADAYDPVIWGGSNEPPAHKKFVADLERFTHTKYASGWSVMGYEMVYALAEGIKKANSTNSLKVSQALAGLTFDTPVGPRRFSSKSHETFAPEFWGVMVKDPKYPFAVIKDPTPLPVSFPTN